MTWKLKMKITTIHVCPPIPVRDFDWKAYESSKDYDPEGDSPTGWGATEERAVEDLLRQIEEARDDRP